MRLRRIGLGLGTVALLGAAAFGLYRYRARPGVVLLENGKSHYGHTYEELAVVWSKWFYETPQSGDRCAVPTDDVTGERCAEHQPLPDVFFLAGTTGGAVTRTKCAVPAGRPLFFPLINVWSDPLGEPPERATEPVLERAAAEALSAMRASPDLFVSVDGRAFDPQPLAVPPTRFSYFLRPPPNFATCFANLDISGKIEPAFITGFFAYLAPLSSGDHEVHFGGSMPLANKSIVVDVTYRLRVR